MSDETRAESTFNPGPCTQKMLRGSEPLDAKVGICCKPSYGIPAALRDAPGRQYRMCPEHGGPKLLDAIAGRVVIRFDGPPEHESGRFIEVERDGAGIKFGEWVQDGEYWLLVLPPDPVRRKENATMNPNLKACDCCGEWTTPQGMSLCLPCKGATEQGRRDRSLGLHKSGKPIHASESVGVRDVVREAAIEQARACDERAANLIDAARRACDRLELRRYVRTDTGRDADDREMAIELRAAMRVERGESSGSQNVEHVTAAELKAARLEGRMSVARYCEHRLRMASNADFQLGRDAEARRLRDVAEEMARNYEELCSRAEQMDASRAAPEPPHVGSGNFTGPQDNRPKIENVTAMQPPTDVDRMRATSKSLDVIDTRTRCITEAAIKALGWLNAFADDNCKRPASELRGCGSVIRHLTEALEL